MEIKDTVVEGTGHSEGSAEFLVFSSALTKAAAAVGLHPVRGWAVGTGRAGGAHSQGCRAPDRAARLRQESPSLPTLHPPPCTHHPFPPPQVCNYADPEILKLFEEVRGGLEPAAPRRPCLQLLTGRSAAQSRAFLRPPLGR
jgi:hypothetical protein